MKLETPKQQGCTPKRNRDSGDSDPGLDPRQRLSFGQVEVSHLSIIDPREELQQASLGWVEIITTVCQELAKLLRSVGEEKERLTRKQQGQGLSHQKSTEVLTNLCQELDSLILGVREKTEGFAEELSCLKHKLVLGNNDDADFDVDHYQQIRETRELSSVGDVKLSPCLKLPSPSPRVEKSELEAHVANLSSCLEDSQVQLKALVIKSSTGNPYLLTSRAGKYIPPF